MKLIATAAILQSLVFFTSAPLLAQPSPRTMTTDMTGSELFFTTTWTLKGEVANTNSKLMRYRSGQLSTYLSVLSERDPQTGHLKNYPAITTPEMTLDGSLVMYAVKCPAGEICTGTATGVTALVAEKTAGSLITPGSGERISANGRWSLRGPGSLGQTLVNLETGASEPFLSFYPRGLQPEGRAVAGDGSVVVTSGGPPVYMRRQGMEGEYLEVPIAAIWATMADPGHFAILQSRATPHGLWLFDLTSRETIPAAIADEGCRYPTLSNDGTRMLFITGANWLTTNPSHTVQAFLMDLNTGKLTQVTSSDEDAAEAVITGDGRSAFVRFESGRITRVDIESGQTEKVTPPMPVLPVLSEFLPMVGGSRYTLRFAIGLNQTTLSIGGREVKVLNATNDTVEVVLPDDLPAGSQAFEVSVADSPFQPMQLPFVAPDFFPRFQDWSMTPMVWHIEGGTAVWEQSPARSGEEIEVLMTGLGAVNASGATTLPIRWRLQEPGQDTGTPIEVLASAKSSSRDEEGYYRVRLRMPRVSTAGNATLQCVDGRDENVKQFTHIAVAP
jgi:uncharacterized protein (TIGR03437 family)